MKAFGLKSLKLNLFILNLAMTFVCKYKYNVGTIDKKVINVEVSNCCRP